MNKEEKLKLLERLVKEGHITLCEAFHLLETEKQYVTVSTYPYYPTTYPSVPYQPYQQPIIIT